MVPQALYYDEEKQSLLMLDVYVSHIVLPYVGTRSLHSHPTALRGQEET